MLTVIFRNQSLPPPRIAKVRALEKRVTNGSLTLLAGSHNGNQSSSCGLLARPGFCGTGEHFRQTVSNLSDQGPETTPPNTAAISAPAPAPDLQIQQLSAYQPGEGITVSMLNGTSQLKLFGSLSRADGLCSSRPSLTGPDSPLFLSPASPFGLNTNTFDIHARQSNLVLLFSGPQAGAFTPSATFLAFIANDSLTGDSYGLSALQRFWRIEERRVAIRGWPPKRCLQSAQADVYLACGHVYVRQYRFLSQPGRKLNAISARPQATRWNFSWQLAIQFNRCLGALTGALSKTADGRTRKDVSTPASVPFE